MTGKNNEHIFKRAIKRVFDLVARLSLIYTFFLTIYKIHSSPFLYYLYMVIGVVMGSIVIIYYISTIYKMIRDHYKLGKSYYREFLDKKAMIGYEVGSFWDVVDRFKGDDDDVAIVLGVNNRFCLDGDYLSKTSLVYNHMNKLSDTEKVNLEHDLREKLKDDVIDYDGENRSIYRNGSFYVSHPTEKIHYETALLSMCEPSHSNISGKFTSTREDLIESFEKLFEQMPNIFTNSTLIIPLIGTKSSGSPLSQEEVAKYLISAFATYSRIKQHRLARKLVISLYDKDFEKKEDLMKIKTHIDMECDMGTFSYSKIKSEIVA
jgi:hypothetical protein